MVKRSSKQMAAILTVVAGILVLLFPSFLKWVVGLFLIIKGLLELR